MSIVYDPGLILYPVMRDMGTKHSVIMLCVTNQGMQSLPRVNPYFRSQYLLIRLIVVKL